jgi:hypothetical protein
MVQTLVQKKTDYLPLFIDEVDSSVADTFVVLTAIVVVVVVALFFFVKTIVVGTTITVITTILARIPTIIRMFLLRIGALLERNQSIFCYYFQLAYSVIETEINAESTLVAIERDCYTKSIS